MPTGLEYLLDPAARSPRPLTVVSGDEPFVKHEVIRTLRRSLLGAGDAEIAWNAFTGSQTEWADIADAVASRSLFGGGGPSVAMIEDADPLVTRCRDRLEDYAASDAAGVVLLDVKSLPGNTRLGKAVAKHGLHIACKTPDRGAEVAKHRRDAGRWLARRAEQEHGVTLRQDAVEMLMDLLPMSLGVLDQEISRLALLADDGEISATLVRDHVGGWRTRTAWEMIDAALEGRPAEALNQLDRLLLAGEQPIGVLAQLGSTLGRFAAAAAAIEHGEAMGRRVSLNTALAEAGIVRFKLADAERQIRRLGRGRAGSLAAWRLDADLAMKGHNSSPHRARIELERMIVRLADNGSPKP